MHTTIVIAHIFNELKNYLNQYIVLCFYKTDQKQLHGISYTSYVILFYLHIMLNFFLFLWFTHLNNLRIQLKLNFFSKTGARGHFRHQIKLQYINERINHFPLFQHARMQVILKKKKPKQPRSGNRKGYPRTFDNVTHTVYIIDILQNVIYMYINKTFTYCL